MFEAADAETRRSRRFEAELLDAVIHRFPTLGHVSVELRYPLMGLETPDHGQVVAFHHGHYVEPVYRLMSRLQHTLFPASAMAETTWDLEAENFAWVDFFWSTLGRSGRVGADVGLLYDMLQDDRALQAIADNLADASAAALPRRVPRPVRRFATSFVLRRVAKRIGALERNNPGVGPLTAATDVSLEAFVEGPVSRQISEEGRPAPDQLTFVFGHTHKPFEAAVRYKGFSRLVHVYNTGGWVVDSLTPDSQQGAAAVLVDEDLRVASLHLYRQVPSPSPVSVSAAGEAAGNSFLARLAGLVHPEAPPYCVLSEKVAAEVPRRSAALRTIIEQGIAQARAR
jgi:hypothetical protein